jgi:crossover junction endodeoxyribonuclease RuvC
MPSYIGIDPGLSGALAILDEDGGVVDVVDTPVVLVKKGKQKNHVYVVADMVALLRPYASQPFYTRVALESVSARPGQGVTSMFSMGKGLGLWIGILTALGFPLTFVTPQSWKKALQIPTGAAKGSSILRARQLFPGVALDRVKDHGRADALLIAEYHRRTSGTKTPSKPPK